jgi:hypothetical protein
VLLVTSMPNCPNLSLRARYRQRLPVQRKITWSTLAGIAMEY